MAAEIVDRQRELAEAAANCTHIGAVGKRAVFTLTLKKRLSFDGQYGTTYVHLMEDAAGNHVVHKGSCISIEEGEEFTVKATVKEHGERDGIKQTILSRPAEVTKI